ncbi:MAG: site-specific integrase [Candidatus Rokubacteria bacterium]|nr:site-specific integrase [Candidatus Rokubacteria bacterium]
MGQLYQRGRIWWVKYYVNGRPVRESTGTDKEKEAGRVLKTREGRAAAGLPLLPRADRVRYEEAAEDLRQHYATTGSRDLEEAGWRLAHLKGFFAGRRLVDLSGSLITGYVAQRQAEKASNGTINRELAVLGRMLRLAYEHGKILRLPIVHKPKEAAPRDGFFEREQYLAVRRRLPEDLQTAATLAYTYGWRMQSEVLTLERRQLDLEAGTLRLDPGTTKNDEGRVVYLTPELKVALRAQVERVEALQRRLGRIIPSLFPHRGKGKRAGEPRGDFRKAWATACKAAGVAGRLRHDFRRTAVRNMVNAGVPERVAMTITGHKTRAVFDRYHIVSPGDLQEAARRIAGTIPGTVGQGAVDARSPKL